MESFLREAKLENSLGQDKNDRHRPIMVAAEEMWKRQNVNVNRGTRTCQRWQDEKPKIRDFWINLARDVIVSLMEPNMEMCESATFLGVDLGLDHLDRLALARSVWVEMIKAAAEFKPGDDIIHTG